MVANLRPNRNQQLYLILSAIFLTNALVAEFAGVKIFSLEKLLGLMPAQFPFFGGQKLDFNLSVGVVIWPIVFIVSDLINEYFGRAGVRRISFITAAMIAWAFLIVLAGTAVPPAGFWLNLNNTDPSGNPFDINYAYTSIFRAGMGIIAGSLTAFLISQLVDAYAFHYLKNLTGHKKLWLRATGSTVISQLIDGFVIDHEDEAQIEGIRASGFDVIAAPTFMRTMDDRANLAKIVLDFAAAIRAGRTAENAD